MAIKGVLNVNIGVDNLGNPIFASVYPKTSCDQIIGLSTFTNEEIDKIPLATKKVKGTVIIGDNVTVTNGVISITADDVMKALDYRPAVAGTNDDSASSADKLSDSKLIQGVNFNGSADVYNYVVCSTPSEEPNKLIELNNFIPSIGAELIINFIEENTADEMFFYINEESYPVMCQSNPFISIKPNQSYHFIYDGEVFQLVNEPNTVLGVKGETNSEYKTGWININKNDIGLSNVDNTADSIKNVNSAIYAERDKLGRSINEYYTPKENLELTNATIETNKELEFKHYLELIDKHETTNDTIADLRTDIINNEQNINIINDSLSVINEYKNDIDNKIDNNTREIKKVYEEINDIRDDVTATYNTVTEGLNTTANVANSLHTINTKVDVAQSTADSALVLINKIDNVAEIAKKDQLERVIDETYAPINNPQFTGNAQAETVNIDNNSNTLATTKFVHDVINSILNLDSDILESLIQIKNLLNTNSTLPDGIMNLIANKQDRTTALINFLNTIDQIKTNKLIYSTGYNTFSTLNINKFAETYLSESDPLKVRAAIDALGTSEKAALAVHADTSAKCMGNSQTADKFTVKRELSTTDGTNQSTSISFDGSSNVSIPLPKHINADVNGTSTHAQFLKDGKNICIDLTSNDKQVFNNEADIFPGVQGILSIKNGGTGCDNLDNVTIGLSKQIQNEVNESVDIISTQFNDEFMRLRFDKNEDVTYLELATADKANAPIYVKQYYGKFDTPEHTITLLDEEGNTNISGTLTVNSLVIPTKKPKVLVNGAIWIE